MKVEIGSDLLLNIRTYPLLEAVSAVYNVIAEENGWDWYRGRSDLWTSTSCTVTGILNESYGKYPKIG